MVEDSLRHDILINIRDRVVSTEIFDSLRTPRPDILINIRDRVVSTEIFDSLRTPRPGFEPDNFERSSRGPARNTGLAQKGIFDSLTTPRPGFEPGIP
jgi:hypothetical protein